MATNNSSGKQSVVQSAISMFDKNGETAKSPEKFGRTMRGEPQSDIISEQNPLFNSDIRSNPSNKKLTKQTTKQPTNGDDFNIADVYAQTKTSTQNISDGSQQNSESDFDSSNNQINNLNTQSNNLDDQTYSSFSTPTSIQHVSNGSQQNSVGEYDQSNNSENNSQSNNLDGENPVNTTNNKITFETTRDDLNKLAQDLNTILIYDVNAYTNILDKLNTSDNSDQINAHKTILSQINNMLKTLLTDVQNTLHISESDRRNPDDITDKNTLNFTDQLINAQIGIIMASVAAAGVAMVGGNKQTKHKKTKKYHPNSSQLKRRKYTKKWL